MVKYLEDAVVVLVRLSPLYSLQLPITILLPVVKHTFL
jgi:hypothetical protein